MSNNNTNTKEFHKNFVTRTVKLSSVKEINGNDKAKTLVTTYPYGEKGTEGNATASQQRVDVYYPVGGKFATALKEAGAKKGDRLSIMMDERGAFASKDKDGKDFAIIRAGAVRLEAVRRGKDVIYEAPVNNETNQESGSSDDEEVSF